MQIFTLPKRIFYVLQSETPRTAQEQMKLAAFAIRGNTVYPSSPKLNKREEKRMHYSLKYLLEVNLHERKGI